MSSDAIDLLNRRRSVPARFLVAPGPTREEAERLLTLAARVPDHGKLAPWRFIVAMGAERQVLGDRLWALRRSGTADLPADRVEEEQKRLHDAPLLVVVVSRAAPHPKIPEWEQVLSAGAVCMNLVVAAHAMGFAANWLTGWAATDRAALDALGVGADEQVAGLVHIGTPDLAPSDRPRPALDDVVTWWKG